MARDTAEAVFGCLGLFVIFIAWLGIFTGLWAYAAAAVLLFMHGYTIWAAVMVAFSAIFSAALTYVVTYVAD